MSEEKPSSITVREAATLRDELRVQILKAIQRFERESDMVVDSVDLDHAESVGGVFRRTVNVDVAIHLL